MKKFLWLAMVVGAGSLVWAGVAQAECAACAAGKKADGTNATAQASAKICQKCGEIAGSDKCCKEGAVKCAKCGLDAGSPGCKAKCGAVAAK